MTPSARSALMQSFLLASLLSLLLSRGFSEWLFLGQGSAGRFWWSGEIDVADLAMDA